MTISIYSTCCFCLRGLVVNSMEEANGTYIYDFTQYTKNGEITSTNMAHLRLAHGNCVRKYAGDFIADAGFSVSHKFKCHRCLKQVNSCGPKAEHIGSYFVVSQHKYLTFGVRQGGIVLGLVGSIPFCEEDWYSMAGERFFKQY